LVRRAAAQPDQDDGLVRPILTDCSTFTGVVASFAGVSGGPCPDMWLR
jgi:hypothetical protein